MTRGRKGWPSLASSYPSCSRQGAAWSKVLKCSPGGNRADSLSTSKVFSPSSPSFRRLGQLPSKCYEGEQSEAVISWIQPQLVSTQLGVGAKTSKMAPWLPEKCLKWWDMQKNGSYGVGKKMNPHFGAWLKPLASCKGRFFFFFKMKFAVKVAVIQPIFLCMCMQAQQPQVSFLTRRFPLYA